jgi:ActR/RegA family two-component response regulator
MKRDLLVKPIQKRNLLPGSFGVPATQLTEDWAASERMRGRGLLAESSFEKRVTVKSRVFLSIGDDVAFDRRLRMAAVERGQIIIRVDSLDAALRTLEADCCGATLLDLDLAGRIPWETADGLLQDSKCPPVILLTGRGGQLNIGMAIQAGSIFEKSSNAGRILDIVDDILEAPLSVRRERNVTQRRIIRWLSPCNSPVSAPAHRFWGINE